MANGKIDAKQLKGLVSVDNGGTNNYTFTQSEILIFGTNSIISSGYLFNDFGTSSTDIWPADKIISYIDNKLINQGTKGQIGIGIGNGVIPITTGVKSYVTVPYSGVITGWELLSTATGSIVIDVWKDTYDNYPPTLSDSICGIDKPTLSSQIKNNNNILTAWSTSITEGDIIAFNVESASVVTQVTLTLKINKT